MCLRNNVQSLIAVCENGDFVVSSLCCDITNVTSSLIRLLRSVSVASCAR